MVCHLIAISGSLRAASANTALLRAAMLLAPSGVHIDLVEQMDALPHFNPDDEHNPPPVVLQWRARIGACDALLIASPEYAHGIPGAFKNALDWLVGNVELVGKPVVLINTSPRATHAQAALAEVLATMGWTVLDQPLIPVANLGWTDAAMAADPAVSAQLLQAIRTASAAKV